MYVHQSLMTTERTIMSAKNKTSGKENKAAKPRRKKNVIIEHPRSSALIFNNRELGWLNFNLRVLAEAEDVKNPLLERLRFLSISSTNLDEFFMKRVGGLKRYVAYGISSKSSDGQTPEMQLAMIARRLDPMLKKQKELIQKITEDLKTEGCHLVQYDSLSEAEKKWIKNYFFQN